MLYAKPCCAVDPIENEEDRKKVSNHLFEEKLEGTNKISCLCLDLDSTFNLCL